MTFQVSTLASVDNVLSEKTIEEDKGQWLVWVGGDMVMGKKTMEVWDERKCFGDSMIAMDLWWLNIVLFSNLYRL